MRNLLIDYARCRNARKRGGDQKKNSLDVVLDRLTQNNSFDFLVLDEALVDLREHRPKAFEVIMNRAFANMTIHETARAMDVSTTTVENEWAYGKAWLGKRIA